MEVYFGEGEETSLIVYRVFYSSLPLMAQTILSLLAWDCPDTWNTSLCLQRSWM